MPAAKVLTKQVKKPSDPLDTAGYIYDVPEAVSLMERTQKLYEKLSPAGKEKWAVLLNKDKLYAWEKLLRQRTRQQAGKTYYGYARGVSNGKAADKVLDGIFAGYHAARCVDWEGHILYGIPAVYAHGEPQRATKAEYIRILQSLFADAGYRDRLCMEVLTMVWEDQIQSGDVRLRPDKKPSGPSSKDVLAMNKVDAFRVIRHSCWMTGIHEGDKTDPKLQSDELRWMIAVARLRVEMRCGVVCASDPDAFTQTVYVGFEALEHGAKLKQVRRGERLRFELKPDEYCTPREYLEQSHMLYQNAGFVTGSVELSIMDLYSEFVNRLGVLSAYSVRKVKDKTVGLKYEMTKKAPGVEFAGIARVSDSEGASGTGMDPEREKLLNELLDERMRLGKAKEKGSSYVKGISVDDLDAGRSRFDKMTSLDG